MRRRKKHIIIAFLSIIIFCFIGWFIYTSNFHFVANANLSNEQIGDIKLGDSSLDYVVSSIQEAFTENKGTPFYYSVSSPTFTFGANKEEKIIYMKSRSEILSTMKDITIGSNIENIKREYGENYIQGKEMGIGNYIMYVDRASNKTLRFWSQNEHVIQIDFEFIK